MSFFTRIWLRDDFTPLFCFFAALTHLSFCFPANLHIFGQNIYTSIIILAKIVVYQVPNFRLNIHHLLTIIGVNDLK